MPPTTTASSLRLSDRGDPAKSVRPPVVIPTDGELLMRFAKHGDTAAMALVVDRHSEMVWTVCTRVLIHRHEAEDAYQATFLILAQKAASIRTSDSAAGWLYRVAHRTALVARRQRKRRREEAMVDEPLAPEEAFPDIQRRQTVGVLMQELRGLPERYQTPLVLRYLEGRSRRAIAEATDATVATIAGRLVRGKRLLRQRLARRGVSLAVALAAVSAAAAAQAGESIGSVAKLSGPPPLDPTFALSTASSAVVQLVHQGVRSMMIATLAKPTAMCAAGMVAIALMMADPEALAAPVADAPGSPELALDVTPADEDLSSRSTDGSSDIALTQAVVAPPPGGKDANELTLFAPKIRANSGQPARVAAESDDSAYELTVAPTTQGDTYEVQAKVTKKTMVAMADNSQTANEAEIEALKELVQANLEIWKRVRILKRADASGGTAQQEAKAKAASYRAQEQLARALGNRRQSVQLLRERVAAVEQEVKAVRAAYDAGRAPLELLLDATRRRAEAKIAFAKEQQPAPAKTQQPPPAKTTEPLSLFVPNQPEVLAASRNSRPTGNRDLELEQLNLALEHWQLKADAAEMMSRAYKAQASTAAGQNDERNQQMADALGSRGEIHARKGRGRIGEVEDCRFGGRAAATRISRGEQAGAARRRQDLASSTRSCRRSCSSFASSWAIAIRE